MVTLARRPQIDAPVDEGQKRQKLDTWFSSLVCRETIDEGPLSEIVLRHSYLNKIGFKSSHLAAHMRIYGTRFSVLLEKEGMCLLLTRAQSGERMALKVMDPYEGESSSEYEEARRECELARRIFDHAYIARSYEFGRLEKQAHVACLGEFVCINSKSTDDYLLDRAAPTIHTAFGCDDDRYRAAYTIKSRGRYFAKTARMFLHALIALAEAGVCHRDIKSDNVLFQFTSPTFSDFRAVIIDFGIATTVDPDDAFHDHSNYSDGNYSTFSPRAKNLTFHNIGANLPAVARHTRAWIDWYSIGVLLIALFASERTEQVDGSTQRVFTDLVGYKRDIDYKGPAYRSDVIRTEKEFVAFANTMQAALKLKPESECYSDSVLDSVISESTLTAPQQRFVQALMRPSNAPYKEASLPENMPLRKKAVFEELLAACEAEEGQCS